MIVICLQGLPASGKTTWARNYTASRSDTIVLSRDALREHVFMLSMAPGDSLLPPDRENDLTEVMLAMGRVALGANLSVIVDAMNLKAAHREPWQLLADEMKASFRIVIMSTSMGECIRRDNARRVRGERFVGAANIRHIDRTRVRM